MSDGRVRLRWSDARVSRESPSASLANYLAQPSLECIQQLFLPLNAHDWPFDGAAFASAYDDLGTYVAPNTKITALHAVAGLSPFPTDCLLPEFTYGTASNPIQVPGCGDFLCAGGHPHTYTCKMEATNIFDCVDQVPIGEAFDIGLQRLPHAALPAPVGPTDPHVGDPVYLIGRPRFSWLSSADLGTIAEGYPLVSYGHVVAIEGRGIVVDNLAFSGNSGGPLVMTDGIVGVAYTKVAHIRAQGTATDPVLSDHHTVGIMLDATMRTTIAGVSE